MAVLTHEYPLSIKHFDYIQKKLIGLNRHCLKQKKTFGLYNAIYRENRNSGHLSNTALLKSGFKSLVRSVCVCVLMVGLEALACFYTQIVMNALSSGLLDFIAIGYL